MTPLIGLGIANILGGLFGNIFGASKQSSAAKDATRAQTQAANRAAELEYQAITDALNYQKSIDERDYRDWLTRESRDRKDWEINEQRRAPFRALSDSAVRTLADYIRVPGMQPAQEIPVQQWTDPNLPARTQAPVSTTMPVGGGRSILELTGGANGGFVGPTRAIPSRGRTLRDLTY